MDASNSLPDKEIEGEQQPSESPIQCEKDNVRDLDPSDRIQSVYREP
jgi:hypothetical protein